LNFPDAVKDFNAVVEGSRQQGGPGRATAQGTGAAAIEQERIGHSRTAHPDSAPPQTPEAAQARTKLNGMGVKIVAGK